MKFDVRMFGDPVLKTRAAEITTFDESLKELADEMLAVMDEHGGVGLAANQIGLLKRIFVYDCSKETPGARGAIINPVWEAVGEDTITQNEGCLSIPGISLPTERFANVIVRGQDVEGNDVEMEATGLLARCIQHETDHLDGVLFLKRLTPELRKEAMKEIRNSDWWNQQ